MPEQQIRFKWVPAESTTVGELESIAQSLRKDENSDVEVESPQGFLDGMTIIAGITALSYLANTIHTIVLDIKHGGLVIDGTTEPITIREDRSLERGTVFFIHKKDVKGELIQTKSKGMDPVAIAKQLEAVQKMMSKK